MQKQLLPEAEGYARTNVRRRIWRRFVRVMACIVVFCTTYALILPAITLEREGVCELEEHTHSDACYSLQTAQEVARLSCTLDSLQIHTHTRDCYGADNELLCGFADFVVHEHSGACFDAAGNLVCTLPVVREHEHTDECYEPAHVHTEDCYIPEGELICELEEIEAHSHDETCTEAVLVCELTVEPHEHTDGCYEQLVCQLPEDENHTHDDSCSGLVLVCSLTEQPHTHDESCYETEYVCGLEETEGHTHEESCYASEETLICEEEEAAEGEDPRGELICQEEEIILHIHDDDCYEVTKDAEGNEIRTLICQKLEIREHVHDESCFVTETVELDTQTLTCTETDEAHEHTDRCYGTWVLTCGLEEHTHTEECYPETEYYCGLEEHTHTEECTDEEGNLICDLDEHTHAEECLVPVYYCELEEHTHTEACMDAEGNLICELDEHAHNEECLQAPENLGDPIPECNCGSEIELKNHPNQCARYQYLRYIYIHIKSAEEIYANWDFMDEEDHDAILTFMSWEYLLRDKLEELNFLIENGNPLEVEFEDGTLLSIEGIPEDAVLVASEGSEKKQYVADYLNRSVKTVAPGFFFNRVYDIKIEQDGEIWQPDAGETVTLTLNTNSNEFNYRTYLKVTHILEDVDAIIRTVNSEVYGVHQEEGLSAIFPEACEAAMAAGYEEDTIIYTIMTPEDGSATFDAQGNVTIHADSFSTYVVSAFNVNNGYYLNGVAGEVEGELLVDKHVSYVSEDNYLLELEAFITGEIKSAPTDVVLVIDHSGSMWSAVDPAKKLSFATISSDTLHGTREGYYICFGKNEAGKDAAALIRYYNGQWQRSKWFATGGAINVAKGFINTTTGTSRGWTALSETDKTYTYYKSISGALYDALNIFMEEMQYAIDCRVAVVTFSGKTPEYNGAGIFVNGSLVFDSVGTPGLERSQYVDAFEDPSSAEGQQILSQTISAINTDYGNTATGVGLLYARRLFLRASSNDRNKVAIVFTDGIPSPDYVVERGVENKENSSATDLAEQYGKYGYEYKTTVGGTVNTQWVSTYADQACSLRNEGALVYSIGPVSGNAGVDVLKEMSSGSDYFFNVGESDLRSLFKRIASVVVESSVALDKDAYLQDIIAGDFTLPAGINPSDVEAYVVPCVGTDYEFETDETKWTRIGDEYITIDTTTNTVQVRGFDYSNPKNFVVPTKAGGNKILVRIPVKAVDSGNKLPTNTGVSAVCNKYGAPAKYFPLPYADVPTDVTLTKQLTGNVADPDLKFDFTVSYTKWNGYNNIPGGAEGDSNYLQTIPKTVENEKFQLGHNETKEFLNLYVGSTITITETKLNGYTIAVEVNGETFYPDKDGTITLTVTDGMEIVFVNYAGYELPDTGGTGTYLYTMGGALLTCAAILLYIHNLKRRKEERPSF